MVDYILEIDWLTTVELCNKYGIPLPKFTGQVDSSVSEIFRIDAIKQKMFVDYAKFLSKNITLEMFVGSNAIFDNFETTINSDKIRVLKKKNENQVYSYLDSEDFIMHYPRGAKKLYELTSLGLFYSER